MQSRIRYNGSTIDIVCGSPVYSHAKAIVFPISKTELLKPISNGFFINELQWDNQPENFNDEYQRMQERFCQGQFRKAQYKLQNTELSPNLPHYGIPVQGDGKTQLLIIETYDPSRISSQGKLNGNIAHAFSALLPLGGLETAYAHGITEIAIPVIPYLTDNNSHEHRLTIEASAKSCANAAKRFIDDYNAKVKIHMHLPYFEPSSTTTLEKIAPAINATMQTF